MAVLRKEFTRPQHRSHTRSVCECKLFLRSVLCDGISCLDQRSSFTLSSTPSEIFCYIILKGVLLPNTWAGQQHKYLKHDGREPVTSKKMTLGQVVPNFTGQVVNSKILRIFRWKLCVTLCSVPLSKWPSDTKKTCRNKLTLSNDTLMFRFLKKISFFRNFFDRWNFSIKYDYIKYVLYFLTLRRTSVN